MKVAQLSPAAALLLLCACGKAGEEPPGAWAVRADVPDGHTLWTEGKVPGMLYSITCPKGSARPTPAEIRAGTCPGTATAAATPANDPDGTIPLSWTIQNVAVQRAETACAALRPVYAGTSVSRILIEAVDNWAVWCNFDTQGVSRVETRRPGS